ncbi:MAG: TonB C-terminal domain-containing protein [Deltaproteobacteria bacterium]|nr:TonB C-terminal domain-containing protein [Deltaproteobacteria bacterium]
MESNVHRQNVAEVYFRKALFYSLGLHIGMVVLAGVAPYLPWLKANQSAMSYMTTLRVDIVDLPREVIHKVDTQLAQTRTELQKVQKKIDQAYEDPTALKFKTKEAIKQIKATQAAIDRVKALQALEQQQLKSKIDTLKRGNIKTPGTSFPSTQDSGELMHAYQSEIEEKIKLRWALPFYLRNQKTLSGSLVLYLDADGTILRRKPVPSGNIDFDQYMNKAVDEALPFSPVPSEIQRDLRYDGIKLDFLARELQS